MSRLFLIGLLTIAFLAAPAVFGPAMPPSFSGSAAAETAKPAIQASPNPAGITGSDKSQPDTAAKGSGGGSDNPVENRTVQRKH